MILFYSSHIDETEAQLEEEEFQHCCKVLRHNVGDTIHITDGKGMSAKAIIQRVNKRNAILEVLETVIHAPAQVETWIAVAPPKTKARWEWLLEKCVEIGIDKITPLITHRTEKSRLNHERSLKVIRSAALQSLRHHHPQLTAMTPLTKILDGNDIENFQKYIAHYKPDNQHISNYTSDQSLLAIIGPEGDFTPEELEACLAQNFVSVNISNNRLRTETAAVVTTQYLVDKVNIKL